jgi:hypothetical protein
VVKIGESLQAGDMRVLIAAAMLLCVARGASASCLNDGQGPCHHFWTSDAVFVARVIELERLPQSIPGNARARVRVVEAFRGIDANTTIELFLEAGDDGFGFRWDSPAELFIYASRNARGELWAAPGCGPSKVLSSAQEDIAYARSLSASGGPAGMVHGEVHERSDLDTGRFAALEGVRVRVTGKGFRAEATTDAEGTYAITLPGAGEYRIAVVAPAGLVDRHDSPVRFDIADRRACFSVLFQLRPSRARPRP